jgi:tripartite-type tricarboxylate transporter receptor subunit TctC
VPALAEFAPGAVGLGWFGVSAPARTPAAVMDRIEQEGLHCGRLPEVHARLAELGCAPDVAGAAEYTRFVAAEISRWTPVVAAAGIKTD